MGCAFGKIKVIPEWPNDTVHSFGWTVPVGFNGTVSTNKVRQMIARREKVNLHCIRLRLRAREPSFLTQRLHRGAVVYFDILSEEWNSDDAYE